MDEDEPYRKKHALTKEQIDDLRNHLKLHKNYVSVIENDFNHSFYPGFSFLKVIESNAEYSCSFSSAWCKTQQNLSDESLRIEHRYQLPFKQLFDVKLLNDVIQDIEGLEKKLHVKQFLALQKLVDFLHTELEHADNIRTRSQVKDLKDGDWAKVICAHLVSKLAVEKDVTLDDEYSTSFCKHCLDCDTELVFGDNSMGHKDVWHGTVDILVGRSAVVTTSVGGDEDVSFSGDANSSEKRDIDKVLAQSIVFSLTQKDRDLAPTVMITKNEMRVYIYEKKHDLLLESFSIPIFLDDSFNPVFVLSLWLALNFRYFTDDSKFMELKPEHERFLYHADFFKEMAERKQVIYRDSLRFTECKHVEEPRTTIHDTLAPQFPISFAPVD